jgi:hypothetical protein
MKLSLLASLIKLNSKQALSTINQMNLGKLKEGKRRVNRLPYLRQP